jgi:hypothetical protein
LIVLRHAAQIFILKALPSLIQPGQGEEISFLKPPHIQEKILQMADLVGR